MKILFRCDSSSKIGLGHIMRDLVLAKKYKNDEIHFACQDLKGNINSTIPYPLHVLSSNETEELIKLIKELCIDLLIIDNYEINYKTEKYIKEKTGAKILCIDDTYEKHFCDILLNPNIYAEKKRYEGLVPHHCELLCGRKQSLLRDEFVKEKKITREKLYDVLLLMGGSDSANLNLPILESLPNSLHVSVVTTSANANLQALKEYISSKSNITLHVNPKEVAKLLNQSKLAIITPSGVVHEVLFMDVPFIAIQTAINQSHMYDYLQNKGYDTIKQFDKNTFLEKTPWKQ